MWTNTKIVSPPPHQMGADEDMEEDAESAADQEHI